MAEHRYWGGWVYTVREEGAGLVKIGHTRLTLDKRLSQLRKEFYPRTLALVAAVYIESGVFFAGQGVHVLLRRQRIQGEWFSVTMTQTLLESLVRQLVLDKDDDSEVNPATIDAA